MALQARLKPHDQSKGHLLRGITISEIGLSFDEGKIVGPVSERDATVLRQVRQRHGDPNSALAFDVLEEAEMKALIAAEARQKLGLTPDVMAAIREQMDGQQGQAPQPVSTTTRPRRPRGQAGG